MLRGSFDGGCWHFLHFEQSDLPKADRHHQTEGIKGEGDKFKLEIASEWRVGTRCGSKEDTATKNIEHDTNLG